MVDCREIQAALSARLDGESSGIEDEVVDAHLAHCADCREFYDRAAHLKRQLNFCVAQPRTMVPPDLSEVILAEVEPQWRRRATTRVLTSVLTRVFMVVLGVIFAWWAVALLVEGASISTVEDPLTYRLLGEAATFRLGLASGLLFAAWKPGLVGGMLPIYGTLWTFSLGFAARDLVLGAAGRQTALLIVLLLATALVLGVSWLGNAGSGVLRRTWSSISAQPA
ncbi:zf-HC2 domain-containing protein [Corynebacterium pacaense]|uniref:zf-HC2 domain-containing protein n=1 Tax=Corynebacterium pacaense TaxID=1816684 RepID=UPI0009B93294|nr:zf-HC2 domain-containing protein [Corynebacterium pacaense]